MLYRLCESLGTFMVDSYDVSTRYLGWVAVPIVINGLRSADGVTSTE
jgi:hypothetical protein